MDASRGPAAEAPTQPGAPSGEAESFEAETKRGRPSRVERRDRKNKGPGSFLRELHPRSIRTAVLVLKKGKQQVELRPDYVGFEIPDVFVVGYGLDYNDAYRNLTYLAALEPSDIEAQPAP